MSESIGTLSKRSSWGIVAVMALFILLLGMPSVASAAKSHFLKIYKVEKHVDLQGAGNPGDYAHEHTFCNSGDYAVDGMWRVDHVDQANPQIGVFGDERDISVTRSYSDLQQVGDPAKWHFELTNNATGRAQVKLFATCIGYKTAENSHQHDIEITPKKTLANFPGGDFSSPALVCGPNEIAVGPGFKTLVGGDVWIKSSYPGNPLNSSWNWNFVVSAPTTMELSVLCLNKKTLPYAGHQHNLKTNLKPGWWPLGARTLQNNRIQEKRVACKDHYKAIVGAFGIAPWNHSNVHFLGMDPRPKSRAFKFWNTDPFNDLPIYLATICLRYKTGWQY